MAKKEKTSYIGVNKTQIQAKIGSIEKHIPIPDPVRKKQKTKYQFEAMKVGDSFLVKLPKDISPLRRQQIAQSIVSCGRLNGRGKRKYLYRVLKCKSIRVWRIK